VKADLVLLDVVLPDGYAQMSSSRLSNSESPLSSKASLPTSSFDLGGAPETETP